MTDLLAGMPGWRLHPAWLLLAGLALATLLVLRAGGRVERAWTALAWPGTWRWGVGLAGMGVGACALLAAGALPAVFGAECQGSVGAQSAVVILLLLGAAFAVGGALCLGARGMLAAAREARRPGAWLGAGRAVGVAGLLWLASVWAYAASGLVPLEREAADAVARQPFGATWLAHAVEYCRLREAAATATVTPVPASPAPTASTQPSLPSQQQQQQQPTASPSQEQRLLAEIRDLLREQQRRTAVATTPLPPIPPAYVPPRSEPSRAAEPRPTARRPVPNRPSLPYWGYPYEY